MKKLSKIILTIAIILSLVPVGRMTVSAEETTFEDVKDKLIGIYEADRVYEEGDKEDSVRIWYVTNKGIYLAYHIFGGKNFYGFDGHDLEIVEKTDDDVRIKLKVGIIGNEREYELNFNLEAGKATSLDGLQGGSGGGHFVRVGNYDYNKVSVHC